MSASHDPHGDDHGHAHGHSPFIQHHYDDAKHQFDSGKLGIWLFLAQEVLFFSALFVAYILYRVHHPEIYSYAHKYLDVKFGAINTAVLIFSSLTAAWAVRAAQKGQRALLIGCLSTTIVCACAFLCIKYMEYSHKVHEHILFGKYFDPCVSSGGNELLTKRNECPGSKTTVVWSYDNQAPKSGCYPDFTYDQDPKKEGVQADCKVAETKTEVTETVASGNVVESEKELSAVPIPTQCPEEIFGEDEAPAAGMSSKKVEKVEEKHPCWKTTRQPEVCKPGYFFQWTCQGKCDMKLVGGPSGTAGPYMNAQKCTEARGDKELAMKGEKDEAGKKDVYALTDCLGSDNTGILVAYGDTEERGEISRKTNVPGMVAALKDALTAKVTELDGKSKDAKAKPEERSAASNELPGVKSALGKVTPSLDEAAIKSIAKEGGVNVPELSIVVEYRITADCKTPPKAEAQGDLMADPGGEKLVLGQRAIHPVKEMSVHEEHEREAAGPPPEHTNMFFTIYFAMTGLHGVHVLLGIFVFIWLLIRAIKGQFTPEYFGPVDYAALYWHIVDLIWIFLFPLLYLIH